MQTEISANLHFPFPFSTAAEYFREGLTRIADGGPRRVELTAHVPATHIELSKDVEMQCVPDPDSDSAWLIDWTPEHGGIYPSFHGRLTAYPSEHGHTVIEIAGHYTPPLGAAGAAFDHVIGKKIALDTMHEFLANLAAEMSLRFSLEEARQAWQE